MTNINRVEMIIYVNGLHENIPIGKVLANSNGLSMDMLPRAKRICLY